MYYKDVILKLSVGAIVVGIMFSLAVVNLIAG